MFALYRPSENDTLTQVYQGIFNIPLNTSIFCRQSNSLCPCLIGPTVIYKD